MSAESVQVGDLAGLRWRRGPHRVLALHGWLDNAHSFLPLADELDGIDLIALDFAGHGESARRPDQARYHFDDYVFDVLGAMDHLGWDKAGIIGHSLGGAVAAITAAAAPERISSLVLIEGTGPLSAPATDTVAGWRRAVERSRPHTPRRHADLDAAAQARAKNGDLGFEASRMLAERGTRTSQEGVYWHHDPRLRWPSSHRYSEPQVLELLGAIECPVLTIQSDPPGSKLPREMARRRRAALRQATSLDCPGGHHLHMHHPARIGPAIKEHFENHEPAHPDSD
ncbi:alpha/beta hydrolase [Wenzhouxiangella sp. AB-CW3]|uniref:alpha/beta fold hydrolase n=1 Tax=Wenzhouxiangella sp. AB-CW3 TaxID=2771012 RepID=UPI00168B7E96|nr:alpha/beta hydrolase [Wenzhouxiangella sp. AB-CW3]QOC22690.1 alpha/beta hydrolase [Wenzhouxiangella sp. AB-CW3]